ncbi:hypothetical protein OQA88_3660 [Cercophora sp. LCS_1]
MALPSSPPLLDNSPSNLSSPLSDVEDKDAEPDDMDLDMHNNGSGHPGTPKRNGNGVTEDSGPEEESDEESKLSEMDINDSEAETERLYDTPPKNAASRDMLAILGEVGSRQFVDRRGRGFERSPSKLQQQLQAELDAENPPSDNDSLSEADDDEDDASVASSEPEVETEAPTARQLRSPSQAKKSQESGIIEESGTSQITRPESQDSRKRKRSSLAEQSESEQPLRKRTGSIGAPEGEFSADDAAVADDEGGLSTNPQSGTHTGEEDNNDDAEVPAPEEKAPTASEDETMEPGRGKKTKRNAPKKKPIKSPDAQATEETHEDPPDDVDGPVVEAPTPQLEDEHAEDADEAEAAHKNEEELEKKKAAWDELAAIEKQFSNFRERLYQERLDQLNREEAMLTCENPTHPEYLAMLQCVEDRRQERIRLSNVELQLRLSVQRRRAVAERAQIMSQFYQAVRESREKVLEELGQEWYEIQHERRRYAHTIPDYSIRLPTSKPLQIRQAVAYNKEVSILSGFAKHVGFPAAPVIQGATDEQLESDLEAIVQAREPRRSSVSQQQAFHSDFAGSPYGGILGPAGKQFIEQTPWANPNHPSHQIERQNSQPEVPIPVPFAGSSSGPRRHSQQPGGLFSSSTTTIPNGDSPVQAQKTYPPSGQPLKIAVDQPAKRDAISQAS